MHQYVCVPIKVLSNHNYQHIMTYIVTSYVYRSLTLLISFLQKLSVFFSLHCNVFYFLKFCYGFPTSYKNKMMAKNAFTCSKSTSHRNVETLFWHYCDKTFFRFVWEKKLKHSEIVSFSIEVTGNFSVC